MTTIDKSLERARVLRIAILQQIQSLSLLEMELKSQNPPIAISLNRIKSNIEFLRDIAKQDEISFKVITDEISEAKENT